MLKAIRDDILAGGDQETRQAALDRQFAVCDPDYLFDAYNRAYQDHAVYSRDEWVFKKVRLWAPTVSFYVAAFDFDFAKADALMSVRPTPRYEKWSGETAMVELPTPDPQGNPNAAVIIQIRMHKHADQYWRVFQIGFAKKRPLKIAAS